MNHETDARKSHRSGRSCAVSVYDAFRDVNPSASSAPAPRSEGGKCGAVLAAEKILRETGTGKVEEFERRFRELYGSVKCADLLRARYGCNEMVGAASRIADELLENRQ